MVDYIFSQVVEGIGVHNEQFLVDNNPKIVLSWCDRQLSKSSYLFVKIETRLPLFCFINLDPKPIQIDDWNKPNLKDWYPGHFFVTVQISGNLPRILPLYKYKYILHL